MTTNEQAVDKGTEQAGEGAVSLAPETSSNLGAGSEVSRAEEEPGDLSKVEEQSSAKPLEQEQAKPSDDEEDEGGSSRLSNIIAIVFVVGLIAFNVYAFWGYNDYGRPEVAPDNPQPALVGGEGAEGAGVGVTAVPGVSAASDDLGASGLSEVRPGAHPPASAPSGESSRPETSASAPSAPSGSVPAPSGDTQASAPVPTGNPQASAPAPGQSQPQPASAAQKDKAVTPPSPGQRPAPIFSKHNAPGSVDIVSMPGPQFLIGVSALCGDSSVGLTDAQRTKVGAIVTKLIGDQKELTKAGEVSLSYLTQEQVDWILNNRGNADISGIEPEAGYDPFTTAYMRMLRSKKHDDGQELKQSKYTNVELSFQDIVNGLLRLEKEQPKMAVSTAQAKALLPVLVMANKARQSEAMHYQQLHDVLTKQQRDWLYNHPEKSVMNVNDVVLNYVQLVVK